MSSENTDTQSDDVSRHLTELDANLILMGALEEGDPRLEHLKTCAECQAYLAVLRAADEAFSASHPTPFSAQPAPASVRERARELGRAPLPRPLDPSVATRAPLWRRIAPLVAAAAALVAAVWFVAPGLRSGAVEVAPPPDREVVRVKSSYDMVVYVHDGERARVASPGEPVHPGDRVGFRVVPSAPGHLMIVGIDQTGETYIGYPQDTDGRSRQVEVSAKGVEIDQALELDDVLGKERLVMLMCEDPFRITDVVARVDEVDGLVAREELPALLEGCVQRELSLDKRRR